MRTIINALDSYILRLTPTDTETRLGASHRESLSECLSNNFSIDRFFRSGSKGLGTSIRGFSDVDYFLSSKDFETMQPRQAMRKVNNAIRQRFPRTPIKHSSPSVICQFGSNDWETTEIIPARHHSMLNGEEVFEIPSPNASEWILACPEGHNNLIRKIDEQTNGNLRKVIRLAKAWKYKRNVTVKSFCLEILAASYMTNSYFGWLPIDISRLFLRILETGGSGIIDPLGLGATVEPCLESERTNLVSRAKLANTQSADSVSSWMKNDHQKALNLYKLVFGIDIT